jgi:hypothetical protein
LAGVAFDALLLVEGLGFATDLLVSGVLSVFDSAGLTAAAAAAAAVCVTTVTLSSSTRSNGGGVERERVGPGGASITEGVLFDSASAAVVVAAAVTVGGGVELEAISGSDMVNRQQGRTIRVYR